MKRIPLPVVKILCIAVNDGFRFSVIDDSNKCGKFYKSSFTQRQIEEIYQWDGLVKSYGHCGRFHISIEVDEGGIAGIKSLITRYAKTLKVFVDYNKIVCKEADKLEAEMNAEII